MYTHTESQDKSLGWSWSTWRWASQCKLHTVRPQSGFHPGMFLLWDDIRRPTTSPLRTSIQRYIVCIIELINAFHTWLEGLSLLLTWEYDTVYSHTIVTCLLKAEQKCIGCLKYMVSESPITVFQKDRATWDLYWSSVSFRPSGFYQNPTLSCIFFLDFWENVCFLWLF